MLGGNTIDLGVSQIRRLLTPAKQVWHINSNLCMYCEDANHYMGNCLKTNRKTRLQRMTISKNGHSIPFTILALTI